MSVRMTSYGMSWEEAHMMRMTPEQQIQEELDAIARARTNRRIAELENALADARRDIALLQRLANRHGKDFAGHCLNSRAHPEIVAAYPHTIPGQREYDAAMHEMEGPPETRESTGAHGYGGPGL